MDTLPLVSWAHPLCGWDATPDLAQATWDWPKRPNSLWEAIFQDFRESPLRVTSLRVTYERINSDGF